MTSSGTLSSLFIVKLILIFISISISYFLGDQGRNLLLISLMFLSPLLLFKYPYVCKIDILLLLLLMTMIISSVIFNPNSLRWSTIIYFSLFCCTFMGYIRTLYSSNLLIDSYKNIVKTLIYAYFIVLLIQQFCVLFNIPIFNVANYTKLNPWKLNSLSPEPSHSAVYLGVLMYCYLILREHCLKREYIIQYDFWNDRWIWFSFLWSMITMISGTAIFYLCIILLKICNRKLLLYAFLLLLFLFPYFLNSSFAPIKRTASVVKSTITLDEDKIIEADLSAAFRLVPSIVGIKSMDVSSIETWTGKGIDYMKNDLKNQLPAVDKNTASISTAFTLGVDYGIIFLAIWIIFSFCLCTTYRYPLTYFFWFWGVLFNGINTQVVWFIIIFLFTNKFLLTHGNESINGFWNTTGSHKNGSSC